MKSSLFSVLVAAALTLTACGGEDAATTAAPAPAPTEAAAPAPAAAKKSSEAIQGTWSIVLGDEEKRQVEVMQMALKDPAPTEEELKKAGLSEDEMMMVALMGAARAADPNDPKVKEMAAAVEGLASATMTVTATDMTFKAGTMTETASYTVQSEEGPVVTIKTTDADGTEETATLTLEGNTTLVLGDPADPTKTQKFTRK